MNSIQFSYEDADPAIRIPQLIDAYFRYVNELYEDGARRFLFMGVPPFDRSPPYVAKAPQDAQKCSNFINEYNLELAKQIIDWAGTHPDVSKSDFQSCSRPCQFNYLLIRQSGGHINLRLSCLDDQGLGCPSTIWVSGCHLQRRRYLEMYMVGEYQLAYHVNLPKSTGNGHDTQPGEARMALK